MSEKELVFRHPTRYQPTMFEVIRDEERRIINVVEIGKKQMTSSQRQNLRQLFTFQEEAYFGW